MHKLKIALLGTGGFMGAHAHRLKSHPDAQLVALCDVSEAIVNTFAQRQLNDYKPQPAVFTDPAAMYRAAKPDAVFIATPHTLHFQHGVQALDHGCHVYMEKPMVTSADHAYALAEKAKAAGKTLVVGYNTPCFPEFVYLRECVRKHTYGKLELISGFVSQNWMKPTTGTWRQDPALSGGGEAYDSGAHLFNSLCWTVESPVREVFAYVDNHGSAVDINSSINIKFESGVMAAITVAGNCPGNHAFMAFMFEHGHAEIDPCGWSTPWITIWGPDGKKVKYPPISGADQTPTENFIDAILGRAQPNTSPHNGIIQSELMDAIYESARTGQPARPRKR